MSCVSRSCHAQVADGADQYYNPGAQNHGNGAPEAHRGNVGNGGNGGNGEHLLDPDAALLKVACAMVVKHSVAILLPVLRRRALVAAGFCGDRVDSLGCVAPLHSKRRRRNNATWKRSSEAPTMPLFC